MPKGRIAPKLSVKSSFAAIQAIDCDDQRDGAFRIFWQTQVADDVFAFEGNVHDFEGRIDKFSRARGKLRELFRRSAACRARREPASGRRNKRARRERNRRWTFWDRIFSRDLASLK